jgi:hypothetical protein
MPTPEIAPPGLNPAPVAPAEALAEAEIPAAPIIGGDAPPLRQLSRAERLAGAGPSWRERVALARARGHFTEEDVTLATKSWLTCAVGEQHHALPTVVRLVPMDPVLEELGEANGRPRPNRVPGFGVAVLRDDFDLADQRLDEIEDRVLQLKRGA